MENELLTSSDRTDRALEVRSESLFNT